jgi:hypothetical protein
MHTRPSNCRQRSTPHLAQTLGRHDVRLWPRSRSGGPSLPESLAFGMDHETPATLMTVARVGVGVVLCTVDGQGSRRCVQVLVSSPYLEHAY